MSGELAKAVCEVIKACGYIRTDAKNDFHGYAYLSDEALLLHVRNAMAANGLCLVPCKTEVHTINGTTITTVHTWTLLHVSGESQQVQIVAQGQDKGDKGPYKAATGALKYALRQTFLIPTGDDPERVVEQRQERKAQAEERHPLPSPQLLGEVEGAWKKAKRQKTAAAFWTYMGNGDIGHANPKLLRQLVDQLNAGTFDPNNWR